MCVECYRKNDDYSFLSEHVMLVPVGYDASVTQRIEQARDAVDATDYAAMLGLAVQS